MILIYLLCIGVVSADMAIPYGKNIDVYNEKDFKAPTLNDLGLIGKTQDFVDSLNVETRNYILFLKHHPSQNIVFNNHGNTPEGFINYNVDPLKLQMDKLGSIGFETKYYPTRKVEQVYVDSDFYNTTEGFYMYCGYMGSIITPVPIYLKSDAEIFRISGKEDTIFYDREKNIVAKTGNKHSGCSGPDVFVPHKSVTEMVLIELMEKVAFKHKLNSMDMDTLVRHLSNGV